MLIITSRLQINFVVCFAYLHNEIRKLKSIKNATNRPDNDFFFMDKFHYIIFFYVTELLIVSVIVTCTSLECLVTFDRNMPILWNKKQLPKLLIKSFDNSMQEHSMLPTLTSDACILVVIITAVRTIIGAVENAGFVSIAGEVIYQHRSRTLTVNRRTKSNRDATISKTCADNTGVGISTIAVICDGSPCSVEEYFHSTLARVRAINKPYICKIVIGDVLNSEYTVRNCSAIYLSRYETLPFSHKVIFYKQRNCARDK